MNRQWTYLAAQKWAARFLSERGQDPEAAAFLLEMVHDWDSSQLLMHHRDLMPAKEQQRYIRFVERVGHNEPPQYVVDRVRFFGRTFVINRDVLIPEVETGDLVEWVLASMPADKPLRVLDLGTGSGVIGITLALERPKWQVVLSDISTAALRVAMVNQRLHGTNLEQVEADLFSGMEDREFDLIVTNPPYVSPADTDFMDKAVLEYEPPLALFASENGLGFYHRLFAAAGSVLAPDGQLFGETGFNQEEPIKRLFKRLVPQGQLVTKHDMADRMRMIRAWNFKQTED